MSDQKRKKQGLSIRPVQTNAQISNSSSSSALSHVDDGSENCSDSSRSKIRPFGRSNKRNCSNADNIKKIVQEEGRIARNLVTWNVPLENPDKSNKASTLKSSGPSSPVKKSFSCRTNSPSLGQPKAKEADQSKLGNRKCQNRTTVQKIQQANSSRKDIRARYWAYLFENLHRAVDEIYQTCEGDESVVECKEVIMMLDQYRQDFNSLIERLHLMQEYEKGDESSRKKNLAWEVRKRSPSKSLILYKKENFSPTSGRASRSLFASTSGEVTGDAESILPPPPPPLPTSSVLQEVEPDPVAKMTTTKTLEGERSEAREASASIPTSDARKGTQSVTSALSTWADRVRSLSSLPAGKQMPSKSPSSLSVDQTAISNNKTNKVKKAGQQKPTPGNKNHHNNNGNKSNVNGMNAVNSNGSSNINNNNNNNNNNNAGTNRAFGSTFPAVSNSPGTGLDRDSEGWETVHRGGKQRQKTTVLVASTTPELLEDPQSTASFHTKSLRLIPLTHDSICLPPTLQVEVRPSASSPVVFSPRAGGASRVILGLPSVSDAEYEEPGPSVPLDRGDHPLLRPRDDTSPSVRVSPDVTGPPDAMASEMTEGIRAAEGTEPNSEVIFANCYRGTSLIEIDRSHEIDEEELNNALMDVLKEENSLELLDVEGEAALDRVTLEERSYLRQIEREEEMQEAEGEDDDGGDRDGGDDGKFLVPSDSKGDAAGETWSWEYIMRKYEEGQWKEESWGDVAEETEARTPGRLVHVFEKLSSPSRKRTTIESRQSLDEKLEKAAELREKNLSERGENLRMLRKKVEEIQSLKIELMNEARLRTEKKLQRAEKKRQILLQMKVRKAHEEDTKASEIAFINTLEAQNKRHEIMAKHQESEARLQDMQEERQRKHEEKAAKEAAAEERRKALEAERVSRLQEMQDRRRQRETDFEQRQQEREKERVEAARARDREREERLAALNKQQQAHIEELQKKIQQKQDETDRRHKEKLEAIQEKAFRMSLQHHSNEDGEEEDDGEGDAADRDAPPTMAPYERKKYCSVCNVLIPSEVYLLSHIRGKTHQKAISDSSQGARPSRQDIEKFNLQHISDAPSDRPDPRAARERERHRAFKKRCKKLKLRMVQRGNEYEASLANKSQNLNSQHKNKLQKLARDLQKCIAVTSSGPWAQSRVLGLDRCLGEIGRIFEKNVAADKMTFKSLGGLTFLFQILDSVGRPHPDLPPPVPSKSLLSLTSVSKMLCLECPDVCQCLLMSDKICTLIDLVSLHLNLLIPDDFYLQQTGPQCKLVHDGFVSSLVELLAAILLPFTDRSRPDVKGGRPEACAPQALDAVSYIVSTGILDKISVYFNNVRGSIDGDPTGAEFLQNCLVLTTSLIGISSPDESRQLPPSPETKRPEDPTQLILTLRATQLAGIVGLMYGVLLHSGAPTPGDEPPPVLPRHTLDVAFLGFRMLNQAARLDLSLFQSSLGEEGTSLEFRHVAGRLLWYCDRRNEELLLHEVVLCLGHFGLLHPDNQLVVRSGHPPTVLQRLCLLPFRYFSDPRLTAVLFPTLVCCCFRSPGNRLILERELSCLLLSNFLEENLLRERSSFLADGEDSGPSTDKFRRLRGQGPPVNRRMHLAARFPRHLWHEAQLYFSHE